jgi:hypothetical protein
MRGRPRCRAAGSGGRISAEGDLHVQGGLYSPPRRKPGPYEIAARRILPAFHELEAIMSEHGAHVAGQVVMRLYRDVDRMHRRIGHYHLAEVLGWLGRMDEELEAYAERMTSMCEAAVDETSFQRLCQQLRDAGYAIRRAEPLQIPNQELPLAWSLLAARR